MTLRRTSIAATLLALWGCDGGGGPPAVEAIAADDARRLYAEHCAICHGAAGDGRGPRRASLHAKPPDFRSAAWRGAATLEGVRTTIREGRPGTDMPAWKVLSEAEIAGLAQHVLALGAPSGYSAESEPEPEPEPAR